MKTRTRKKLIGGSLKTIYGEMILRKNTILYHSDDKKFNIKPEKPMLFLTFHPKDWNNKYVTKIELKRDVSLFFMVGSNYKERSSRIPSLLNTLTRKRGKNLNKQNDNNLKCYISYLNHEGFDGWFSTIEGKTGVEIALINNLDIYNNISSEILNNTNWKNSYYNNVLIPAKWGEKYPIYTTIYPAKLIINKIYKTFIEDYKEQSIKNGYIFPFEIVLKNADIEYVDKNIENIFWNC
jgi:hypothetical protein